MNPPRGNMPALRAGMPPEMGCTRDFAGDDRAAYPDHVGARWGGNGFGPGRNEINR